MQSMNGHPSRGLEKPLREMLVRAQERQISGFPVARRPRAHTVGSSIAAAEKAVPPTQEIPHAGIAAGTLPDFEDAVWEGACTVTNFSYRWPQEVIAAPWHTGRVRS